MNVADPVSSGKYSGTCVSVPPVRTSVGAKRLVFLCGGQAMEVKHDETNGLSMCVPLFLISMVWSLVSHGEVLSRGG